MTLHMDYPFEATLDSFADFADVWVESDDSEWVWSNVITTDDGHMAGADGSSDGLTGGYDRRIVALLRASADIVVMGAATVRNEPLAVPRDMPIAIVSRSATPPPGSVDRADGGLLVITTDGAESEIAGHSVAHIALFTGESVIGALRERGYRRILCEGGADLVSLLLNANLIDRWYQTVSPASALDDSVVCPVPEFGAPLLEAHDDDGYTYGAVQIRDAHLVSIYDE